MLLIAVLSELQCYGVVKSSILLMAECDVKIVTFCMESLSNIGVVEAAVISWSCGEEVGSAEDGGLVVDNADYSFQKKND